MISTKHEFEVLKKDYESLMSQGRLDVWETLEFCFDRPISRGDARQYIRNIEGRYIKTKRCLNGKNKATRV